VSEKPAFLTFEFSLKTTENIAIALRSIKGTLLRTLITVSIIGIGITALVGMLTAITGLELAINKNFSRMGANTFTIKEKTGTSSIFGVGSRTQYAKIDYRQLSLFKEKFPVPSQIAGSAFVANQAMIQSYFAQTNPNNRVLAIDNQYLDLSGSDLQQGRNFSEFEISKGSPVCVIGYDVANALFPQGKALDSTVNFKGIKLKVVGILNKKGGSMGYGGEDRVMYLPIQTARAMFLSSSTSYIITVGVERGELLEPASEEARNTLRSIRKLAPEMEDNFEVAKSNNATQKLMENLQALTFSATILSFITLIGAAIGLMNIMLVSVTERTREIGTRIALGAKPSTIQKQFLMEALVICQLGGIAGVVMGISIGNIVGALMDVGFFIPWAWIILAFAICLVVGLGAGYYPAKKAGKLNPIDALRHE
jgi:putative ABC transport system permease protein